MADIGGDGVLRQLEPHWNRGMIAASIAISLLGAFTSTQLMCQARASIGFNAVLVWTLLASLTFGFCSIWSLHFVAMLAYELDILIGIKTGLTVLSSALAVVFTFAALAADLLWDTYSREQKVKNKKRKTRIPANGRPNLQQEPSSDPDSRPLLGQSGDPEDFSPNLNSDPNPFELEGGDVGDNEQLEPPISQNIGASKPARSITTLPLFDRYRAILASNPNRNWEPLSDSTDSSTDPTDLGEQSTSGQSSSLMGSSSASTFGLSSIVNIAYLTASPAKNVFLVTGETLYLGLTPKNIAKGFVWSLAITSMHYAGIGALNIPSGYYTLNYPWVVLSGMISWLVCVVGCILMSQMETHLGQQFLFSVAATAGVTSMHFTGMRAATLWTRSPPTEARGYPPALATAVVSIAIATCIAANGLLAHAVTVSRNKLAEIVSTRKKLWRTIAQKENAEAAAAARSDFIASASHEIRTPLHHLQGYSDLLSQTELTEEGRLLLHAIQRATKTLSLITNNVLDWSKLERDSESVCRPVALDIKTVCEAILVLLPNKDDEAEVEMMVVVSPDVPNSIFLDETYIHRILMNLLSNALKFTRSGYILLLVEFEDGRLVATVKDTGPGIPPSFLPQLFEPFKQAQTRSSQRGTGLGLSIVKQLLHNMNGSISVESKHPEVEGWSQDRLAVLSQYRSLCNVTLAWLPTRSSNCLGKLGFEVVIAHNATDLAVFDWKYIWADIPFLKANLACLRALLNQETWTVLVPYDTLHPIHQIPELDSAPQFIPLPRPLMWHSFSQRIAMAKQGPVKSENSRTVRFATTVDFVDGNGETESQKSTAKNLVIMLVEDNPINQKLGQKMLTSLGYKVWFAENGQEAIDQVLKNDLTIDAILMDQSMPVKDGVMATKEIREMEAAGTLSRRHPIIALTAVVNSQAQALFKSAGADDFLAKPLSLAKLEHTLSIHLHAQRR